MLELWFYSGGTLAVVHPSAASVGLEWYLEGLHCLWELLAMPVTSPGQGAVQRGVTVRWGHSAGELAGGKAKMKMLIRRLTRR